MATFTLTAEPTELVEDGIVTLTLTADSSFKDSVDLSGSTVNGSVFTISPASLFLCNSDVKTAKASVTSIPTADSLTITATGGGVSKQVKIDLLP